MDGTLFSYDATWTNHVIQKYQVKGIERYPMNEWLLETKGIFASQYCAELIQDPCFYVNEDINPQLLNAMKQWIQQGNKVIIVTAPHGIYNKELSIQSKKAQIQRYLGTKFLNNVIFTNQKYKVEGDYMIDDSPEMIEQEKQANWKLIMVDSLYSVYYNDIQKLDVTNEQKLDQFQYNFIQTPKQTQK